MASIHLCIYNPYASLRLCIDASMHLSIYAPMYLCICLSMHPFVYVSMHLCNVSIHLIMYLFIYSSIHPCIYASIQLCIYNTYLCVYLCLGPKGPNMTQEQRILRSCNLRRGLASNEFWTTVPHTHRSTAKIVCTKICWQIRYAVANAFQKARKFFWFCLSCIMLYRAHPGILHNQPTQLKELVMRFLGLISMSQHISKSRETVVGPEPWSWTHAPPCTSLSNPPWTRCDLLASLPYTSANEWRTFWRQDAAGTSNGNLMGLIWEYLRAPLQHCICRDLKNFRKSHCFCSGLRSLLHMHCCPTIVARTCPVPR